MSEASTPGRAVIAKARAGDLQGAIAEGEAVLTRHPADAALRLFVGVLCCRERDLERGIVHLRRVLAEQPGNAVARIEFAQALLSANDSPAVLEITADATLATRPGRDLTRVRAHALQHMARTAEARDVFAALVAADHADFESLSGLGLALVSLGEPRAALAAFRDAVRLKPAAVAFWINLSRTAAAVSEWGEAADAAERGLALAADEPLALLAAARAHVGLEDNASAKDLLNRLAASTELTSDILREIGEIQAQMRDFVEAEKAFRRSIATEQGHVRAWVGLGDVIERLNRHADLEAHLTAAAAAGIGDEPLALLRARSAYKAGRHAEALALARAAPREADPATRAQLIGTLADRLGDYGTAFAAFTEANAAIATATAGMEAAAGANITNYAAMRALMTPDWLGEWAHSNMVPSDGRRDPLFIFGFPRSGTTLIDTMLSGHPCTAVLEEEAIIQGVASMVGRVERVPSLSPREIGELREHYFAKVRARFPEGGAKLIVDKEPFGLSSTLLLHRLFPNARFVFAERHPCDVVLSCWMTSLRFDHRVGSFHDLAAIARLYDAVLGFWTQCVRQLPIATTTVRYERLVATPEAELRKLADFAGLDWRPTLLANERNAAQRGYIGSPSYAQVAEPLYRRAAGRWINYLPWIAPILPILTPWIRRLGYDGI